MTVHISTEYKGIAFNLEGAPATLRSDLLSVKEAIDCFLDEEPRVRGGSASEDKPANEPAKKKAPKKEKPAPEPEVPAKEEPAKDDTPKEPEAEEPAKDEPAQDETPDAPEVTQEQLRQQVMAYAAEHGNTKGKQLVEKFCTEGESAKISNIPEDKYLEAYLAAGGAV